MSNNHVSDADFMDFKLLADAPWRDPNTGFHDEAADGFAPYEGVSVTLVDGEGNALGGRAWLVTSSR